jgi:N-acetylglucosaminyldiphosphoundecaprenol N-acetyl-beta-D-mannosaminyltransferase
MRSLSWTVAIRAAVALRRFSDALLAGVLFVILCPLFLLLLILAMLCGGGLRQRYRLGRWATHFGQYEFYFPPASALASLKVFSRLPSLLNILKGDMSFIGPRAVSPDEVLGEERAAWKRYNLRPGLLSLWWLRKRANIAYSSEVGLDLEYVETNSLWGDLGIAVRAIPAVFMGGEASVAPPKIKFLGVTIDNLTMSEASVKITEMARAPIPTQVSFVNADCVNIAFSDSIYKSVLHNSQLVLADGIGVRLAGSVLNQNVRENINGTDMLPFLCGAAEEAGVSIYLLGGRPGIPEVAAEWIAHRYPRLRIAGCRHGYFTNEEEPQVLEAIRQSHADILLVALGAPRQEKWIAAHKSEFGAKVGIGVGGLLDFYSGRIPRAPVWMRELGLEWFYRFWQEPRRMWRRYFVGNAVFLYRVAGERIHARASTRTGGVAS